MRYHALTPRTITSHYSHVSDIQSSSRFCIASAYFKEPCSVYLRGVPSALNAAHITSWHRNPASHYSHISNVLD